MKNEYRKRSQDNTSKSIKRTQSEPDGSEVDSLAGKSFGLLGLGDKDYAINTEIFKQCADRRQFVKQQHQAWHQEHQEVVCGDAIEAQTEEGKQCTTFCRTERLMGVCRIEFNRAKGLLTNICRSLKPLYKGIEKQIGSETKLPLLLARWVYPDNSIRKEVGWMISHAMFRPFRTDGIRLNFPEDQTFLKPPYILRLSVEAVRGADKKMFKFECMDSIAAEIARLKPTTSSTVDTPGHWEYCFRPACVVCWQESLSTFRLLNEPSWVVAGEHMFDAGDDDDDSDDDAVADDDSDVLDEIQEMVAGLTGNQFKKPTTKSTRKPRGTKRKCPDGEGDSRASRHLSSSHPSSRFFFGFPFAGSVWS